MSFPILNVSSNMLIGVCTIDAEKLTELLTASNIVSVSSAENGGLLIVTSGGRQVHIRGIAKIVNVKSSRNGDSEIESITTPTCANIVEENYQARFFYCAKVSRSERNAGLPDDVVNKHPIRKGRSRQ